MGEVLSLENNTTSLKIKIKANRVLEGAQLGDSIATNGVCLTATKISKDTFEADCMHETVNRTALKYLKPGDKVNLESSITLATKLGGHLVTGDVDTLGTVTDIRRDGIAKVYVVEIPTKYTRYIVEKGRITIDGASLTVIDVTDTTFSVSLIPHTQDAIILGSKNVNDKVNIETDIIGKYIEKFMTTPASSEEEQSISKITKEFLLENGF